MRHTSVTGVPDSAFLRAKVIYPGLLEHVEKREIMNPATVPAVGNDRIFNGQGGES
ncbi:MAG: hypothetical protein JXB42_09160 [Deltaproteobacteria bacterium]|nr:hypothetical protein [Deltaproteobacteria bacterium]